MPFAQLSFHSEVLQVASSLNIILPQNTSASQIGMKGIAPDDDPPVLWLLHGMSDDHTIWMRRTSIERYASEAGLAVVMPNAHRSYYQDMAHGYRYNTFLREELPTIIQQLFRVSRDPAKNFIAGLSMGGYGAFLLALQNPGRYAAAASLSGALDIASGVKDPSRMNPDRIAELENIFGDPSQVEGSDADLFALIVKNQATGQAIPPLLQICGTEDFLYQSNVRFRDFVQQKQIPLQYHEAPGDHSWAFWDQWIRKVIDWLPIHSS